MVPKSLRPNLYFSFLYSDSHSPWVGEVGMHTTGDSTLKGPENSVMVGSGFCPGLFPPLAPSGVSPRALLRRHPVLSASVCLPENPTHSRVQQNPN